MNTHRLLALTLIFGLLASTAAAAPLAGPCTPGAAYDSACDANQDGEITVADLQLTAGHWNQTGTFTSDNNHTHLGQTWTDTNNPLTIEGSYGSPYWAPLILSNSGGVGVRVNAGGGSGVWVESAGNNGVLVDSAGNDGLFVCHTGTASGCNPSLQNNGVEIGNAQHDGLRVTAAGYNGVYLGSTGYTGFTVYEAGTDGLNVHFAVGDGVHVGIAGQDGIDVSGVAWAGNFAGDINVSGNCFGCRQANFAVNAGDRALQPGDVVSVQAVTPTDFDTAPALWQVVQAQPGQAVIGVVAGRAELVTEVEHRPMETGKRLVPRDGAAQPGEYLTIVYSGPMQVKAAPGDTAIAAGARLTVGSDGHVRPLQTRTVEGMVVTEGAPVVGVALGAAKDGLVWVLVNPQ
jgi:hypothetical protein